VGDVAYFWLGSPADLCQRFRSRGIMVAREMINCTLELRRNELRKAYSAMNLPDGSGISDSDITRERDDILATDVVFCPNAFVKESVVAYGFPAERCIETSYGWSKSKLTGTHSILDNDRVFTAAFVGTVDVRKGAPLLLEAWARSNVSGRLLLAGKISPEVQTRYAELLKRPDVVCLGHVKDVGSVYRSADVFCFPTWEEGGPQVTLEAMAAGNVPIVTLMGTAGAFSETEDIGIIVPPGDVQALSDALKLMAQDSTRREQLSKAAQVRSKSFSWDLVGQRRRTALVEQRSAWLDRIGK
jgi:glycosyltransferase involved in cell wall biosynthesis